MRYLAFAAVVCSAFRVDAQSMPPQEPARMLPGGEWAIGQWEGSLHTVGTSSGTTGLASNPRILIIRKDANGRVDCFFSAPGRLGPTTQCTIGQDRVAFVTGASAEIELRKSGPDTMQGTSKPQAARGRMSPGIGDIVVTMKRAQQ